MQCADSSDSEPAVLADYILAILKKECDSAAELETYVNENLEDFLKGHTADFVTEMFGAIRSGAYLSQGATEAPAAGAGDELEAAGDAEPDDRVCFALKLAFYLDPLSKDTGCLSVVPGI